MIKLGHADRTVKTDRTVKMATLLTAKTSTPKAGA